MSFTPPPGPGPYPDDPNNPGPYGQPGPPGGGPPPYPGGGPPQYGETPPNPGAPPPLPGDALPPTSGAGLPPLPGDSNPYPDQGGYPGAQGGYPGQQGSYPEQSWGFDPAVSGPPVSGPPPNYDPTGMYGPRPPGPPGMPPPPPQKSHTGLIVGIVAGVVGLLLILGIGGVAVGVHYNNEAKAKAAALEASASAAASDDPYNDDPSGDESDSPTPSPSATARDESTLDNESTDETPFEMSQFYPNEIGSYSLEADGSFDGCTDSGGSATQSLMKSHGCDDMGTGSYLNSDSSLLVSAMVIPLTASSDADAVVADFKKGGESFTGLSYYCPKSGAGASVCDSGNSPRWYAWYIAFHRYVIVSTVLRTDLKDTDGSSSTAKSFATDVLYGIEDQMLVIQ